MKKAFAFSAALCLLLLCACQSNPQTDTIAAPGSTPSAAEEPLRTMTPKQGGDMLYPVYYKEPGEGWQVIVEYLNNGRVAPGFYSVLGLINELPRRRAARYRRGNIGIRRRAAGY